MEMKANQLTDQRAITSKFCARTHARARTHTCALARARAHTHTHTHTVAMLSEHVYSTNGTTGRDKKKSLTAQAQYQQEVGGYAQNIRHLSSNHIHNHPDSTPVHGLYFFTTTGIYKQQSEFKRRIYILI